MLVAGALFGVFEMAPVITELLVIGLPLLLLVVAITTWVVVGRAANVRMSRQLRGAEDMALDFAPYIQPILLDARLARLS